jgi:prepilin-type N-terminal cleavage/methylation domain-containing protein
MKRKLGFTLVEIMIVVAVIGLLATIALPSFVKARSSSQSRVCMNNLRVLDSAKEQAAMAYRWANDTLVDGTAKTTNCLEYIKGGKLPSCPSSGTYTWCNIGTMPTCSVGGLHTLPNPT